MSKNNPENVRRALLTDHERAVLTGEQEVEDQYRWEVVARIRRRMKLRLPADLEAMDQHQTLGSDLRELVCEGDQEASEFTMEAVERHLVATGRVAPLCEDCGRRISRDEYLGEAEPHDCPAV